MPSEVCSVTVSRKSAITCCTWSRETFFIDVIAVPSFWTSFGPRCLSTLAASSSPRLIRKIAARSAPDSLLVLLSLIFRQPVLDQIGRQGGLLAHHRARCGKRFLVRGRNASGLRIGKLRRALSAGCRAGKLRPLRVSASKLGSAGFFLRALALARLGAQQALHQRPDHGEDQHDADQCRERQLT